MCTCLSSGQKLTAENRKLEVLITSVSYREFDPVTFCVLVCPVHSTLPVLSSISMSEHPVTLRSAAVPNPRRSDKNNLLRVVVFLPIPNPEDCLDGLCESERGFRMCSQRSLCQKS